MAPKVGDKLPDVQLVDLTEEGPKKVSLRELFKGKKGVLVGVPGAFTPGCHKTHLPGYIQDAEKIKAAGSDLVVLITVNDPFVTKAWADSLGAAGKVTVLSDPAGEATKALGTEWEGSAALLGTPRSIRYSAVIVDDEVKTFNAEDGGGLTCSLSNQIIDQLKSV